MITEDYVSFEIAKLLKEKGFNEPCECLYDTENNDVSIVNGWMDVSNSELEGKEFVRYSAPTLQMAMKWLRKKHNLYIDPYPEDNSTWCLIIWKLYPKYVNQCKGKYDDYSYSTYEEACEAAIKYCLENLI